MALITIGVFRGVMLSCETQPEYDVLIAGGHILDGTGSPWYEKSLAVKDGKIAVVGRLVNSAAKYVIDATRMVIVTCP